MCDMLHVFIIWVKLHVCVSRIYHQMFYILDFPFMIYIYTLLVDIRCEFGSS